MFDTSELIFNIDRAEVSDDKKPCFYYDGWISGSSGEVTDIRVFGDVENEIPVILKFIGRPDLKKAFKRRYIQENAGFSVCINDIDEIASKYSKIGLYAFAGGQKKLLAETDSNDIKASIALKNIKYCVDYVEVKRNQIIIVGWAMDTAGEKNPDISLYDQEGNLVRIKTRFLSRPDVNKIYDIDTEDFPYIGFMVKADRSDFSGTAVTLRFSVNDMPPVEHMLDLKEFSPEARVKKFNEDPRMKRKFVKKYGRDVLERYIKCLGSEEDYSEYMMWQLLCGCTKKELQIQSKQRFEIMPLISIVIPLYNTPLNFLDQVIGSVQTQSYGNFELCLADGSSDESVGERVAYLAKKDRRIKYQKLEQNTGISGNTNGALKMACGDYIVFADHDDVLAPNALYEIVSLINETKGSAELIYSAEDKITMDGEVCFDPIFKQKFNPDFLRCNNYMCHIVAIKRCLFERTGFLDPEYDGAQDHEYMLRCIENTNSVYYIPKVLYHWRAHKGSTASDGSSGHLAKSYAYKAGEKAVRDHYKRMGIDAAVSCADVLGIYRAKLKVQGEPKVSVIIPNKDNFDILKKEVRAMLSCEEYKNLEILIIDNKSESDNMEYNELVAVDGRIKIINTDGGYNKSELIALGLKEAEGDYVILSDGYIEMSSKNWIQEMLGYCQREDVGAVGAKIRNIDGTTKHLGIVMGTSGLPEYAEVIEDKRYPFHYIVRDVYAVSGSCIMVKREALNKIEALDTRFTDIMFSSDLCMQLRNAGYTIVFDPYAQADYLKKGKDKERKEQRQREEEYFANKWKEESDKGDPYRVEITDLSKIDFSNPEEFL